MKHFQVSVWLALAGALPLWAAAQGQAVWRCGPEGRLYSDTPCAEGRVLAATDARPGEDLQAARQMAEREQRLGEKLIHERLQREAVRPGAGLAGFGPASGVVNAQAKKSTRKPAKRHHRLEKNPADADIWSAAVQASRRKKG